MSLNPDDHKDDIELDLDPLNYPRFGVLLDLSELLKTDILFLSKKPISEQMKYANAITRKYAKNERFKDKMIMEYKYKYNSINVDYFNPVSLGDLACLAFYDWEMFGEVYNNIISQLDCQ